MKRGVPRRDHAHRADAGPPEYRVLEYRRLLVGDADHGPRARGLRDRAGAHERGDHCGQWGQLGRHDFTLFADDGALLACDAGAAIACIHAADQQTGTTVLTGLPKGSYHLVVDADTPGDEGGVLLRLSGLPAR